jgi:hypothetical protein
MTMMMSALMLTSGGTIQGYNGQALVDDKHQIIVHGQAFGSGQDQFFQTDARQSRQ